MSNSMLAVLKKFYDEWNIEVFILFSLSLQAILILFAPFRKRAGNVMAMIWVAYLLADWAASFAVGLISNGQKYSTRKSDDYAAMMAFWAPFLLLHLGGPDTVTAYSLEDNALWKRHLVGLLNQVVTAMIVFSQTFPRNKLWVPTVLLFVAGTIKYSERTGALFLANPNKYRENLFKSDFPWPTFEKLMGFLEEHSRDKELEVHMAPIPDDLGVVYISYCFFKIFEGLIVDIIMTSFERRESRLFFQNRDPGDAFKVLAIELNFMYDVLYTKVVVVRSLFGCIVRFISWCAVVAAFSTFYSLDKRGFSKIDVRISYTLLFGAIAFDTIALFMVAFSDWTVVSMREMSRTDNKLKCKAAIERWFLPLLGFFLSLKKISWGEDIEIESKSSLGWARRILFRRWHESLHTFTWIDYFLKERPKKNLSKFQYYGRTLKLFAIENLGLKDFIDQMKYVSKKPLTKKLWVFIFDELKRKSDLVDDPDMGKRIYSARGDWVLQNTDWISTDESSKLMHYIADFGYDESLILWHIATEVFHHHKEMISHEESIDRREFCKILSEYMLYLLVMQPSLMSAAAGIGQKRFRDTYNDAKNIFIGTNQGQEPYQEHKQNFMAIYEAVTDGLPASRRKTSLVYEACDLAKELGKLECQKRWSLMSEVWVELLSYAASHCRANAHAAQLNQGGQFITFVWLLMSHFGIGDQIQIFEGPTRENG